MLECLVSPATLRPNVLVDFQKQPIEVSPLDLAAGQVAAAVERGFRLALVVPTPALTLLRQVLTPLAAEHASAVFVTDDYASGLTWLTGKSG